MSCFLQKKFVSEPPPPLRKSRSQRRGRVRPRSSVRSAKETTPLSLRTCPMRTTMKRHYRTAFSCDRGLAVLAYLMFLLTG
jgi:hypothetical protein